MSMGFQFKVLVKKEEMLPFFPLFHQLNATVGEAEYAEMLDDMTAHGYRMLVVLDGEKAVGLSGFWVITKFYSGKYLEMDNVVVDAESRSLGIGKLMCEFLEELGQAEGVRTMMLDAYLENHRAHAFYEREGFVKRGYHMIKNIGGKPDTCGS